MCYMGTVPKVKVLLGFERGAYWIRADRVRMRSTQHPCAQLRLGRRENIRLVHLCRKTGRTRRTSQFREA